PRMRGLRSHRGHEWTKGQQTGQHGPLSPDLRGHRRKSVEKPSGLGSAPTTHPEGVRETRPCDDLMRPTRTYITHAANTMLRDVVLMILVLIASFAVQVNAIAHHGYVGQDYGA